MLIEEKIKCQKIKFKNMCVTEFRRLCEASEFRSKGREQDLKDPNLEVRKETYFYNGRSYHYVTDKRKLKGLENYLNNINKKS